MNEWPQISKPTLSIYIILYISKHRLYSYFDIIKYGHIHIYGVSNFIYQPELNKGLFAPHITTIPYIESYTPLPPRIHVSVVHLCVHLSVHLYVILLYLDKDKEAFFNISYNETDNIYKLFFNRILTCLTLSS